MRWPRHAGRLRARCYFPSRAPRRRRWLSGRTCATPVRRHPLHPPTPVILGAITLDLFAVLFGGAVALLPLFAQVDPAHRAVRARRAAQPVAVGALVAGLPARAAAARRPRRAHAAARRRRRSARAWSSSASRAGSGSRRSRSQSAGSSTCISMNIRSTTVALATPNELRGRVNAVEGVFIGASNELGAFESGAAAALARRDVPPSSPAARSRSCSPSCGPGLPRPCRGRPARGVPSAAGLRRSAASRASRSSGRPRASRLRRTRARARRRRPPCRGGSASGRGSARPPAAARGRPRGTGSRPC